MLVGGCVGEHTLRLSSTINIYRLCMLFVEAELPSKGHNISASKRPACVTDSAPAQRVLGEMTFG